MATQSIGTIVRLLLLSSITERLALLNLLLTASARKRDVIVMGKSAFDSYVDSVQAHISALNETAKTLRALIRTWVERV